MSTQELTYDELVLAKTIDRLLSNKLTSKDCAAIAKYMAVLSINDRLAKRLEDLIKKDHDLPKDIEHALDTIITTHEQTRVPSSKSTKPILALDFDGVLHSYTSGWTGPANIQDDPVPGAIEFLQIAVKHFTVCIYSSRSSQLGGIDAMHNWLYYWANQSLTVKETGKLLDAIRFPTTKPSALLTIDDRALQFDGTWPTVQQIKDFKPWNKR